ncbi:hypothetical protein CWI38_2294p0010 [Hamiltosporidium tvaerminnensis]|uniref:Integrase catalytic domain-containing protein n=1 Tax=Hamiltosporidium tvaerminnensis TaxID=1176355 RepID=A0A4Q9LJ18_9MICR|nr:hypothetical protein CWI38_2294p0010 [Hamiltosporidium tvaerminnensis]
MFWDGIRLQIPMNTIETISFDRRKGLDVILGAEMHKQPIPPLKQVDNEEDDVKTENTKNILPFILDGINTAKEPTTIQMKSWSRKFTLFGDDICFIRRDHLIRAVFGFETALIKQIIQTGHAVPHFEVNKMMALMAYIKEYVKECEACSRFDSLKTIQPIYINHITKKYDLFMMDSFLTDLNIKIIHGRPRNLKAQGRVERVNQTIKRWLAKKFHDTDGRRWMEHFNNFVYAYTRTIHGATNKSLFMPFFRQPGFNNTLSGSIIIDPDMVLILEIASDVHEEFTETVNTTTTIITDDLEIDSKIRLDVAKHFKNYRERILENNNLNRLKRDFSSADQVLIKKNKT